MIGTVFQPAHRPSAREGGVEHGVVLQKKNSSETNGRDDDECSFCAHLAIKTKERKTKIEKIKNREKRRRR